MVKIYFISQIVLFMLYCLSWIDKVECEKSCQTDVGDGICTNIYECPEILNNWKKNVSQPVYCSEEDQIACCPKPKLESNLRISEKKCLEYLKYTFEQVKSLPEDPEDDLEISYLDRCGISTQQYAIVGGEDTLLREYPHMAAIGDNTVEMEDVENFIFWYCAGSLISENFVLTAAHCVATNKKIKRKLIIPKVVKLGAHNLDNEESAVQIYEVDQIIAHPEYQNQFVYNDIGLLKLKKKVEFNVDIRPICLPVDTTKKYDQIWAIGWGNYKGASYEGVLQKLQLPLVTRDECSKTYNSKRKRLPQGLQDSILCYGAVEGVDTCPGASGGPVQVVNRDVYCSYLLVGITSAGVRCTEGFPGLFTKVAEYLDWIETRVWA